MTRHYDPAVLDVRLSLELRFNKIAKGSGYTGNYPKDQPGIEVESIGVD